jgi:heme/copper-type cytochrome/quinol oxidase subunit 2
VVVSIATSAAESRAIPTATPPEKRSVWGGYGAFGILVVVLLLLIGYATLVRRRQQKRLG